MWRPPDGDALRNLAWLEEKLGYEFEEPELLRRAVIHYSAVNEGMVTKEEGSHALRLSWLGDAALQLMVSDKLYTLYPSATEGQLHGWRSKLTNNSTLGRVAAAMELEKALTAGKGAAEFLAEKKPQGALATALESVFGAVFVDGGVQRTRSVIRRVLGDEFDRLLKRVEGSGA